MSKTVFITGASRGIGRACALAFAASPNSYHIVINARSDSSGLNSLAEEISGQYSKDCLVLLGDIGDFFTVADMFEQIHSRFGAVDILINNAGVSHIGLLSDMTPEDWNHVISANLSSLFNTCKHAVPDMVHKQCGKIINISSVWGSVGASCEVAYSASKGGVNSFTKALAKELAPSNIQVNAIALGVMDTSMNACFSPEELADLTDEIPAGRLGTPEEAASLILALAQGHSYLTGQIITLDGGWY